MNPDRLRMNRAVAVREPGQHEYVLRLRPEWHEALGAAHDVIVALTAERRRRGSWSRAVEAVNRRGKQLIEVVERALEHEPIPVEGERPAQPHPADAVLIALGEALVRARALESKVAAPMKRASLPRDRARRRTSATAAREKLSTSSSSPGVRPSTSTSLTRRPISV